MKKIILGLVAGGVLLVAVIAFANAETINKSSGKTESNLYENHNIGFSMQIPISWEGKYSINEFERRSMDGRITKSAEFVHNVSSSETNGAGWLFSFSQVTGEDFTADEPPVMSGQTIILEQTHGYTYYVNFPSGVEYNEAPGSESAVEYKEMKSQVDFLINTFKLIGTPKEISKLNSYTVYPDIKSQSEVYTLKKLDIPAEIRSYKTSCTGVIDKDNILLVLSNDQTTLEIGVYNHTNRKYQTAITLNENQRFEICCLSTEYIVLRLSDDNWATSELFYYSFSDKTLNKIFSYSIDPKTRRAIYDNTNMVLLLNNSIYFDDFYSLENTNTKIKLYSYDIESSKLTFVKEHSQNPIYFNGTIYTFEINSKREYKSLNSLDDEDSIKMNIGLIDIASNEKELYCLENKGIDVKTDTSILQIKEIKSDVPIISITLPIDMLECNNNFVTWRNFGGETPCLYDINEGCIILFDGIKKGVTTFSIRDNYGILYHRIDENDHYSFETYFFETK